MRNSKQETIADIVAEMRGPYYKMGRSNASLDKNMMDYMSFMANRIEAAAKREVEELRECLREAVIEVCNRLEKCGFKEPCVFKTCYVQKWRKALKGAEDEGK